MSQYHGDQPRLSGDGMDSVSLLIQDMSQQLPRPPSRHRNLNSTPKTTSSSKPVKPKFIPHEPVKGAVKDVKANPVIGNQPPYSNVFKTTAVSQPKALTLSSGKNNDTKPAFSSEPSDKHVRTFQVPVYNAPSHLHAKTYESMQKKFPNNANSLKKSESASTRSAISSQMSNTSVVNADDETKRSTSAISIEDRQIEGEVHTPQTELRKMKEELEKTKEALEVQSTVNADLKKLLVASMGDDLQYKVESLARTKAFLAQEVGGFTQKLTEDYEDIDKLSIQADMWRSKYSASRVLVEELQRGQSQLSERCQQSEYALREILQERHQIRDELLNSYRHLYQLNDALGPRKGRSIKTPTDVIELASTNAKLADAVRFSMLGGIVPSPTSLEQSGANLTTHGEQYVYQILFSSESTPTPGPKRVHSNIPDMYMRFHPDVRYENITFNCCGKCKGDLLVV